MVTLSTEIVLQTIKQYGPIISNDIRRRLGQTDSTLVNVYISELLSKQAIKQTHVRLGSSPFNYIVEQREKLTELVNHLNEKDLRVANRLREEKVIRASDQDPLSRVALQSIKDFSVPITVKTDEGEEIFYRWFLTTSEEAREIIHRIISPQTQPDKSVASNSETVKTNPPPQIPQKEISSEQKEEARSRQEKAKENQKQLIDENVQAESAFGKQLLEYFSQKNIICHTYHEIRKDSDIEAIVEMDTPVGRMKFFCKARSKKSSNDGDLASAILLGKKHMLPALYVTTGSVTKKAQEQPELQEVTVVEIGSSN